jgi:hypothetical protein
MLKTGGIKNRKLEGRIDIGDEFQFMVVDIL